MFNGKTSSNGSCSTVHRQKIKFRMVCELLKGGKVLIHMIYIHYSLSYPSILVVISMMSNQYSLKKIRCPSQKCLESLPKTSFFQGRAVKLQGCNLEVTIKIHCRRAWTALRCRVNWRPRRFLRRSWGRCGWWWCAVCILKKPGGVVALKWLMLREFCWFQVGFRNILRVSAHLIN